MCVWGNVARRAKPKPDLGIVPGLSLPVTSSYVPPAIASPNPEPARRLSGLRCIRRQTQHKQHPAALQDGVGPENGHAHLPPYSPSEDAQGDLLRLEEQILVQKCHGLPKYIREI